MRFSPTRIVLATLALIIGAVLALPMLLSRKAEAGDAPPKLEADVGAGWLIAAEPDTAAERLCDSAQACLLTVAEIGQPQFSLIALAQAPPQLPDSAPTPLAVLRTRIDQLAYVLAPPPEAPWPDPQTIDRQRKYHLRP